MVYSRYEILSTSIADLDDRHPPHTGGIAVGRLHDAPGLRVRTIAIDQDAALAEHVAGATVLIHVIAGRARIEIGGQSYELTTGAVIHADAHTPHSVHALEPTRLVLSLIG